MTRPYVMVSADFPDVTPEQRAGIYTCLKQKKWDKITGLGRDISTVWWVLFEEEVSYEAAIRRSADDFVTCALPYTTPKLVIHVGPDKPHCQGFEGA